MSNATQAIPAFDVRDEIRAAINSGSRDPYKISRDVARRLPPDVAQEYIELRVLEIAREIMSSNRTRSFVETVVVDGKPVDTLNTDRWRSARVYVPGKEYVRYDELTAEDCIAVAELRETEARGIIAEAKRFRSLGAAVNKYKVKTAGELSESVRMDIFK